KVLEPFKSLREGLQTPPSTSIRIAFTFGLCVVSFVFFRAPSLRAGGEMVARMFAPADGLQVPLLMHGFWVSVAAVVVGHAIGRYLSTSPFVWWRAWLAAPAPVLGFAAAALIFVALIVRPGVT